MQWIELLVVIFILTESRVACLYLHRDERFQERQIEGGINELFVVQRPDVCLH